MLGKKSRHLMVQIISFASITAALLQNASAQTADLPKETSALFAGSGNCALCHVSNGEALQDSLGNDLSPVLDWASTMMANAFKDPLWQAKVESEVDEFPALQKIIEDKCTTCHAPMARTQAIFDQATGYSLEEGRASGLALDGVSCTVCHQIQPGNLGTEDSFSGGFVIDDSRIIYGPYADVETSSMKTVVNYEPVHGAHMQGSELCAVCHTLFTPFVDDQGDVAGTFPEQVPYLEWLNSDHAREGRECQDCHMPRVDEEVIISSIPPTEETQSPFWRHIFVGGNAFMLQILRDNGTEIGVTATQAQFDSTIARTREQLQQRTARLTSEASVAAGQLTLAVNVENLTGHKFPTGFPSRRAWLHVLVNNESGERVFESGGVDAEGRIENLEAGLVPHRDHIDAENQAQIYESRMVDVNGDLTYTLLRGARYIKDNRIPPAGFITSAERYADMAIHGGANDDANFNRDGNGEGAGSDLVTYLIDISEQTGELSVRIELLYQTVNPGFTDDLFTHETTAVQRFQGYFDAADKTPELIQSSVIEIELPATGPFDYNQDEKVDFEDFFLFADHFGTRTGDPNWDPAYDADQNGSVNFEDFFKFADAFGKD